MLFLGIPGQTRTFVKIDVASLVLWTRSPRVQTNVLGGL